MNNYPPPGYMPPGDPNQIRNAYADRQRLMPPDQMPQMPTPPMTGNPMGASTPTPQPGQFPQQPPPQMPTQNYSQQQQVMWPAPPGATPGGSGQVTYPPNYGNTNSPRPQPQPQGTPKAVIVVGADGKNYVYDPNSGQWTTRPQGMR